MEIFIVEDDKVLRQELIKYIEHYGYKCIYSDDFKNITQEVLKAEPDLLLLDINLPYQDGYTLCRNIRRESNMPIIIVTSRNTDMDELMSMNLGADDFVTKPYNTQILMARIEALLRRSGTEQAESIKYRGMTFYPGKNLVEYEGKQAELTPNEQRILFLLLRNRGEVVSREDLMDELWQSCAFVDDNTLTVNVNRLRKKLLELGVEDAITTRRGVGYVL